MTFFIISLLLPVFIQAKVITPQKNELQRLYLLFDKDRDTKITVDDKISPDAVFKLKSTPSLEVKGTHGISVLAQEMKYAEISKKPFEDKLIFENPVDRISRLIRERYWDGLTRRIDPKTIEKVISDSKIDSPKNYLYVPEEDTETYQVYKNVSKSSFEVIKLPKNIPAGFVNKLGKKQGLLSLAMKNGEGVPYVVPGGRFNEMYGWDSYFHSLGVIHDGKPHLAKSMVDNFVYEIRHYGKVLNANRTYYLTRSQPPFLTSMIIDVIKSMKVSEEWKREATSAALFEYNTVWMGKDRLTDTGLSRYAGFDEGIPPEVEEGHFDHVLKPFAEKHKISVQELKRKFNEGKIKDQKLIEFFHQDRAVRESGHDTTYRWRVGKEDRASDFVTVDLNSLLYKYELDLAWLLKSDEFLKKAARRKELIRKYLWDEKEKMFFDYNWKEKVRSRYESATAFYPLWASHGHEEKYKILNTEEAKAFVGRALKSLEEQGGLAATSETSLHTFGDKNLERQWDYPFGWAPHQILTWVGLKNYKFDEEAERLIYKWLYMITKNAIDYNGTIPEKFNVKTLSHKVFAEYGNVGTKFSYITLEGFGWMNASYQLGLSFLSTDRKARLKKLEPYHHQPKPLR